MKQMLGFSAEVGGNRWHKFEVTLEEGDWEEMRHRYELPEKVPTALKFLFLENELSLLVATNVSQFEQYRESATETIAAAADQRKVLIDKMRQSG